MIGQVSSLPTNTKQRSRLLGVGAGFLYGLIGRIIFGLNLTSSILSTLSGAFLIGIPFALGALVIALSSREDRKSWWFCATAPFIPGLLFLGVVMLIGFEVFICIIMASPIFLLANSLGGLTAGGIIRLFDRRAKPRETTYAITLLLVLPYLVGPVEHQISVQDSYHTVHNQITIQGTPEEIWSQIISVPTISEAEQHLSLFQLVGIPRPIEATLQGTGIGSERDARFDNGLHFVEMVTNWELNQRIDFSIDPDTRFPIPAPFELLDAQPIELISATYVIEPTETGTSVLHLSSRERVSTRVNFYSGWWVETVMSDLQQYILEIIKARVEGN